MTWLPPLRPMPALPGPDTQGTFAAVRKHDIHTGVDLHCPAGSPVHAVEPGIIVSIVPFTGPDADSPWWLPTDAVMVAGPSGVVLYGEVVAPVDLRPGVTLAAGEVLGHVSRVLRNDKGKPTSMLHLELYAAGTTQPVWWRLGEPCPKELCDPTPFIPLLRG